MKGSKRIRLKLVSCIAFTFLLILSCSLIDSPGDPANGDRVVILAQGSTGVGGAWQLRYFAYLLRKNGDYFAIYRTGDSPEDLNESQFRQSQSPSYWGKWRTEGKSLILTYGDQSRERTYEDFYWFDVRQGKKDEKLDDGRYVYIAGGGNSAFGGTVVTGYSRQFWFDRQGKFSLSTAVSGGTGNVTGVFSDPAAYGTYFIDGYTIELKFGNGIVQRRLFYVWTGNNSVNIGVGGHYFNRRD